jgi:ComF family protein
MPLRRGHDRILRWPLIARSSVPSDAVILAAAYYRSPVREALLRMKFSDEPGMAVGLSGLLLQTVLQSGRRLCAVAAVPLHPDRLAERGYNQAGLLAEKLARQLELPDVSNWLLRTRPTDRQSAASGRSERIMNLSGAFSLKSGADPILHELGQQPVLLIDDVLTTGATLTAAAEPLWRAGCRVTGLILASDSRPADPARS